MSTTRALFGRTALAALGVVGAAACLGCSDPAPSGRTTDGSGRGSTGTGAASATASATAPEPGLEPVYPRDGGAPDPSAERLCAALHDVPAARHGECCGGAPRASVAGECTRTLSFALSSGALTLVPAELDACVAAMQQATAGCGWVGTHPLAPPPACERILHGTRKSGELCRSSLECAAGQSCRGLSAVHPGTCSEPRAARSPCRVAIDTLASLTRQDQSEDEHPECAGYCSHKGCVDAAAVGAVCAVDGECGRGHACRDGKCDDDPPAKIGQPCGRGSCARGALCLAGTCSAPKEEGASCESDAECRGACLTQAERAATSASAAPKGSGTPAGSGGVCGMRCGLPPWRPSSSSSASVRPVAPPLK